MKFDEPIVRGLCSFGFACRMMIDELIPGEPERSARMEAQMSSPLLPGTPVPLKFGKLMTIKHISAS